MQVYIARYQAISPTSNMSDILGVYEDIEDAKICIKTASSDLCCGICQGDVEGYKKGEYNIAYDDELPWWVTRHGIDIYIYDDEVENYDHYWVECQDVYKKSI